MNPLEYRPAPGPEAEAYDRLWSSATAGTQSPDKLSGKPAFDFFITCGLPKEVLKHIWDMADPYKRFFLEKPQFDVAVRLICVACAGLDINVLGTCPGRALAMPSPWSTPEIASKSTVRPKFQKQDRVAHTRTSDGLVRRGIVVGVHDDDAVNGIYYTVRLDEGNHELQAAEHKLRHERELDAPSQQQQQQQQQQQPIVPQTWAMTQNDFQKFRAMYNEVAGRFPGNHINTQNAADFFSQCGLNSDAIIATIRLCDLDHDNFLNEIEFCIACHILDVNKNGYSMPTSLPVELAQLYAQYNSWAAQQRQQQQLSQAGQSEFVIPSISMDHEKGNGVNEEANLEEHNLGTNNNIQMVSAYQTAGKGDGSTKTESIPASVGNGAGGKHFAKEQSNEETEEIESTQRNGLELNMTEGLQDSQNILQIHTSNSSSSSSSSSSSIDDEFDTNWAAPSSLQSDPSITSSELNSGKHRKNKTSSATQGPPIEEILSINGVGESAPLASDDVENSWTSFDETLRTPVMTQTSTEMSQSHGAVAAAAVDAGMLSEDTSLKHPIFPKEDGLQKSNGNSSAVCANGVETRLQDLIKGEDFGGLHSLLLGATSDEAPTDNSEVNTFSMMVDQCPALLRIYEGGFTSEQALLERLIAEEKYEEAKEAALQAVERQRRVLAHARLAEAVARGGEVVIRQWSYLLEVITEETKRANVLISSLHMSLTGDAEAANNAMRSQQVQQYFADVDRMNIIGSRVTAAVIAGLVEKQLEEEIRKWREVQSEFSTNVNTLQLQESDDQIQQNHNTAELVTLLLDKTVDKNECVRCGLTLWPLEASEICKFSGKSFRRDVLNLWLNKIDSTAPSVYW